MRVLLIAEDCNPDRASEPLVAYNACKSISYLVDAVVVTQVRNKSAIESKGLGNARVVYLDTEYLARPLITAAYLLRLGSSGHALLGAGVEFAFEREVWKAFRSELQGGMFDIVHRVTPISAAIPSPLASWSPVPFVLGPVNGGLAYPAQFRDRLHKEREWLRYFRRLYRLFPYVHSTYRQARAILAAFPHTIEKLPSGNDERVIDFPENGVDKNLFRNPDSQPARRESGSPLTFVYVGRLVPFKCVDVVIEAFGSSPMLRSHRLLVIGSGPCAEELGALVKSLGLEDRVVLAGNKPQAEVARHMQEADVFVFPSIRDSGAGVIIEAMMAGLPCVVVDYGPGASLITEECGLKIRLGNRSEHVAGFATAMETLASNEAMRQSMAALGKLRAEQYFDWNQRARRTIEVYRWVLKQRATKPEFYSVD
jgi:glycosyltransferase involved in cell wall biosynthesis